MKKQALDNCKNNVIFKDIISFKQNIIMTNDFGALVFDEFNFKSED